MAISIFQRDDGTRRLTHGRYTCLINDDDSFVSGSYRLWADWYVTRSCRPRERRAVLSDKRETVCDGKEVKTAIILDASCLYPVPARHRFLYPVARRVS